MADDSCPKKRFPRQGRIAAVDYGHVRLGLAITDPDQNIASPYQNYTRRSLQNDADFLRQFVADEAVVGLVVGLPIHLSGDESEKSREVRRFGIWVEQQTGLPVTFYDERYTSVVAEQLLAGSGLSARKRKERLDMLAAQIILLAYLESGQNEDGAPGSIE